MDSVRVDGSVAASPSDEDASARLNSVRVDESAASVDEDASVIFWRDSARWCPYCASVEIALRERRVAHTTRLAPLRCYGGADSKPAEFVALVGSDGTLPVLVVDGRVHASSRSALAALCDEDRFPAPAHPSLLGGADTFAAACERDAACLAAERELAVAYGSWLLDERGGRAADRFYRALDAAEALLESRGGEFFGGAEPSFVDALVAPTLERAAAVAAYVRSADISLVNRGDAAAETWIFRGDKVAAATTFRRERFAANASCPQVLEGRPKHRGRPRTGGRRTSVRDPRAAARRPRELAAPALGRAPRGPGSLAPRRLVHARPLASGAVGRGGLCAESARRARPPRDRRRIGLELDGLARAPPRCRSAPRSKRRRPGAVRGPRLPAGAAEARGRRAVGPSRGSGSRRRLP